MGRDKEFAGLSYDIQNEKILGGKQKFKEEGINIDAFMAPFHSFDETTLRVLVNNEIKVVTDGSAYYPYFYKEILFVPQLLATPRKMPFGIYTWCLHPNTMNIKRINMFEKFIKNNQKDIICFSEAKNYVKSDIINKIGASLNKRLLKIIRTIRGTSV